MKPKTIYDYPVYYDILFGWDRSKEAGLYHAAFERSGVRAGARILEVACGTGQVARRLARRGWRVTGLDLKPGMLAFLHESAAREGLAGISEFDLERTTEAPAAGRTMVILRRL